MHNCPVHLDIYTAIYVSNLHAAHFAKGHFSAVKPQFETEVDNTTGASVKIIKPKRER
uniref:Uncharacterized protein n=1 Tax=Pseudonaja textilis TaxID=8673 RepID=A0A670XVZ5_PSETE